jgi:ferritin-like metal-binding protein YciE
MITAVTTMMTLHDELRDLHAARFAEMAALREMLVLHGSPGNRQLDAATADRMRDTVAEILRLQRAMSLSQE